MEIIQHLKYKAKKQVSDNIVVPVPITITKRFNYSLSVQNQANEFLFEYIKAWGSHKQTKEQLNQVNSVSLIKILLADSGIEDVSFASMIKKISKAKKFLKPKDNDEWIINNTLTILSLIKNKYFKITLDNYETLINIFFKNTNIDLLDEKRFIRNEKTISLFKGMVQPRFIKVEMDYFFKHLDHLNTKQDYSLTQAIIIFAYFLKISPYAKSNFLLATVMMIWYISQNDKLNEFPHQIYFVSNQIDLVVKAINECFENEMKLDPLMDLIKKNVIKNVNDSSRSNSIKIWYETNNIDIFGNDHNKLSLYYWIISEILGIDGDITITKIKEVFTFKQQFISNEFIKEFLTKMIDNNMMSFVNKKYEITNEALLKIRLLLKNNIILK